MFGFRGLEFRFRFKFGILVQGLEFRSRALGFLVPGFGFRVRVRVKVKLWKYLKAKGLLNEVFKHSQLGHERFKVIICQCLENLYRFCVCKIHSFISSNICKNSAPKCDLKYLPYGI